jgi:CRP-like cAMP-binding protein
MMTHSDLASFGKHDFGRSLSAPTLERLFGFAQERAWLKSYRFITQGDVPTDLAFILEGRVSLTCERSDGEQAVIDVLDAGQVTPLANIVLASASQVTVTALTAVRARVLSAHTFRNLLREDGDLSLAVMQKVAQAWSRMVDQNKALKLQNTNQRLAHFLLQHTDADDGAVEVRLLDERRLMARRLGMTPESLSRAIAQLQSCGVEFNHQRVLIRDVDRLRQFCGLQIVV